MTFLRSLRMCHRILSCFSTFSTFRWLWIFIAITTLVGCGKVDLYSDLSERDANAMLAILSRHHIQSEKVMTKGVATLRVEAGRIADAIEILKAQGYPKDQFVNIGTVFKKEGLISSPLEERIRYIYALSQEVAEMLSRIDGVLTARVNVVLPETQPFEGKAIPSSASVFIRYREGSNVPAVVPQIKTLVQNSIEGLQYDKIAVALFPAPAISPQLEEIPLTRIGPLQITRDSVIYFWGFVISLLLLVVLSVASTVVLLWQMKKQGITPWSPKKEITVSSSNG